MKRKRAILLLTISGTLAFVVALGFAHNDLWWVREAADGAIEWNARIAGSLVAALLCFGAVLGLHTRQLARYARSRRALDTLNATVLVVIVVVIAVFLNRISHRRYLRFDATARGLHTVSERTLHVLTQLDAPVRAHVFFTPEANWYPSIRGTLDTYAAESGGRFTVEYVHPGRQRDLFEQRLRSLGIEPRDLPDARVVVFEQVGAPTPRTRHVGYDAIVVRELEQAGPRPVEVERFRGEEAFTRAVLAVSRSHQPTVAFLGGHGELDLAGASAARSLKSLERKLLNLDYNVEALRLVDPEGVSEVPERCDVLAIVGPQSELPVPEIEAIGRFMDRGGRMLVLTEPVVRQVAGTTRARFETTRIEQLLEPFAIVPRAAKVSDDKTRSPYLGDFSLAARVTGLSAGHAITRPLDGRWIAFHHAQPLDLAPTGEPGGPLRVLPLVEAGETAKAVGIDTGGAGEGDTRPIVLAAAARKVIGPEVEARVVAIGDASAANDRLAGESDHIANLDLLVNAIAWLAHDEDTISVDGRAPDILHLRLDPDRLRRLWLLSLLELPAACVLVAFVVWTVRRG